MLTVSVKLLKIVKDPNEENGSALQYRTQKEQLTIALARPLRQKKR